MESRPSSESGPGRPFRLGYQPGLDGLRGLLVVMIMIFHSFVLWGTLYGRAVPGAYVTLNMFFVLSGFLITSLLLTEHDRRGGVSFASFYGRRALRLLPALVVLLLAFMLYAAVMHRDRLGETFAAVGWISIYASNWAQHAGKMQDLYNGLSLGHTWTLAVEEQFYVVWPLLIALALHFRSRLRVLAVILIAGVVVVTIERMILTAGVSIPAGASRSTAAGILERRVGIRTDVRADTLFLGALAAVMLHGGFRVNRTVRSAGTVALVGLIITWLAVQPDARWMYSWGFTIVDIAAALLCLALVDWTWGVGSLFRTKPLVWLGRLSYALYLWHLPVFVAVSVDAHLPVGVALVVAWGITFACAIASYYLVELWFLRRKGRLSERAHGPAPVLAAEQAAT
jgi:peptidoglycan/LPS O-acetylase OafA/YrhL